MAIKYEEQDGRLRYEYRERERGTDITYVASGFVPASLCRGGIRIVKAFVANAVTEKIDEERRRKAQWIAFLKDLNVPISVKHRGVVLEGRIIHATHGLIITHLDEPKEYQGESPMHFGFASHMKGHYVFDERGDTPCLSEYAIEGGKTALTWIYDERKHSHDHGDVIALARKLNR